MEGVWTVDVWFSRTFPVNPDGDDWRRVHVAAPDAADAELVATQIVARPFAEAAGPLVVGARGTPVASLITDWPDDPAPASAC